VLALVGGRAERARIEQALRGTAEMRFFDRLADLQGALAAAPPHTLRALIVDPADVHELPAAIVVRSLVSDLPHVPVIGYVRPGRQASRVILDLAGAGVHELLIAGTDDVGIEVERIVASSQLLATADRALRMLGGVLTDEVRPLFDFCLRYPEHTHRVSGVAAALGVHRRTLVNACARAALPSPMSVTGWCRMMLAGGLFGYGANSVKEVALAVDLNSATSLRNMLRRYTGLRPNDLQRGRALRQVVDAFLAAVHARQKPALVRAVVTPALASADPQRRPVVR